VESLRSIGRMARESGLTVSALRFYDGAGVLVPASVDPDSGYRYYAADQVAVARLVAALRRVRMPLARIRDVLAVRRDPAAVDALLDEHLQRLEQGLADARRELSRARSLIAQEDPVPSTTLTVRGAELAAALRAVRYAVGADPELPILTGVLFDVAAEALTLVATDRYRLAAAAVPVVALDGPPVAAVVPAALVDRIPAVDAVRITVDGTAVEVVAGVQRLARDAVGGSFPDYRRLLPDGPVRDALLIDDVLRAEIAAAPTSTLRRDEDGTEIQLTVLAPGPDGITVGAGDDPGIAVDREFLLEALDGLGPGQLVLSLDGPIAPIVIRSPRAVSLLMPVRR